MKWYYIAIPVGLLVAYMLFSPKSTMLKGGSSSSTSGWGSTLTGAGNAAKGGASLWTAIFGSKSDDESDDSAG